MIWALLVLVSAYEYDVVRIKGKGPECCLFLHGHRGSPDMVRGILKDLLGFCDVVAFDFKEDISGISSFVIWKQTRYVLEYLKSERNGVFIVAHSMGAVPAILAAGEAGGKVKKIVTLNSPLLQPPINSDWSLARIYSEIHDYLFLSANNVFSITGAADSLVPASLTNPFELNKRHVYTTALPKIYSTLTHNEIMFNDHIGSHIISTFNNLTLQTDDIFKWFTSTELVGFADINPDDIISELSLGVNEIKYAGYYSIRFSETAEVYFKCEKEIDVVAIKGHVKVITPVVSGEKNVYRLRVKAKKKVLVWVDDGLLVIGYVNVVSGGLSMGFLGFEVEDVALVRLGDVGRISYLLVTDKVPAWVYGKCGTEEIVGVGRVDHQLQFHEVCEGGPELWVVGEKLVVRIEVQILRSLEQFFRCFRLYLVSIGVGIFLFVRKFSGFTFLLFVYFGDWFRYYGLLFIDHVDLQELNLTILEAALLGSISLFLALTLSSIYKQIISIKPTGQIEFTLHRKFIIFILLILLPWPTYSFLVLFYPRICSQPFPRVLLISFLLSIPQQVSYFWTAFLFEHLEILSLTDLIHFVPLLSQLFLASSNLPSERFNQILSIYCILFSQDLLYRLNLACSLTLIFSILFSYEKTRSKISIKTI